LVCDPALTNLEIAKSGHKAEETSLTNISIVYLDSPYSVQGHIILNSKSVENYSFAESLSVLSCAATRRQGTFASMDAWHCAGAHHSCSEIRLSYE